jgi:hypothetical protein
MSVRPVAALLLLSLFGCGPKIGDRCKVSEDCKGLEDGYCAQVQICTRRCGSSESCEGGACVSMPPLSVCLRTCSSTADCHADESCEERKGSKVCIVTDPLKPPQT